MFSLCRFVKPKLKDGLKLSCRLMSSKYQERIVDVGGTKVNLLEAGEGPHPVLCLPGALGSIWTDFKPQIEGLDKSKFRVFAWDPPGYGGSRPPNKSFGVDFYHQDAQTALGLVDVLGLPQVSLLGWSDGGITALIMAGTAPARISRLAVWGANAYVTQTDINLYLKIRDTASWSKGMRESLEAVYGAQGLQTMWASWCDALEDILRSRSGNICKDLLPRISCRTLILHGDKDPLVPLEHPEFLKASILNSQLVRYPEGKHNIHIKYANEFNSTVSDFLLK